jgi:hypothetical protein
VRGESQSPKTKINSPLIVQLHHNKKPRPFQPSFIDGAAHSNAQGIFLL